MSHFTTTDNPSPELIAARLDAEASIVRALAAAERAEAVTHRAQGRRASALNMADMWRDSASAAREAARAASAAAVSIARVAELDPANA